MASKASTSLLSPVESPETPHHDERKYFIQTAILLNRSPTLSHPPTSFEAAYYEYNAKIGRALFNPFPYQFYFKSGSVLKSQFNKEERLRDKEAFNWAKKPRRGKHNAELKSGKTLHPAKDSSNEETEEQIKAPVPLDEPPKISAGGSTIAISGMMAKEEEEEIMSRTTDADLRKDVKSLDRKGHRNLYLLIKRGKGLPDWTLPGAQGGLRYGELLHEAAERELYADCGVNIDAWIVGRHPIGYMDDRLPSTLQSTGQYAGCKTFFFKAHIMAGQVDPTTGSLADFAWMTKSEVRKAVKPEYWTNIRDIMSDF
ncbi:60S ribosomal protein L17 [Hysterangium stoloniferum]|nr:60S ribosomal protein L17 [Hysterangium stoloniferum]